MTGQGCKTTGDCMVGPQLSKNKNKGVVFLENWPLNFLSLFHSVAVTFIQGPLAKEFIKDYETLNVIC